MDIIVGGPLKPNGQNVPTRVGEIVSDYAALANIPNPRVGMEVWVAKEKMAVRILTLKEATIAGVVVPNAVVDTWEVVPNRAMTTELADRISVLQRGLDSLEEHFAGEIERIDAAAIGSLQIDADANNVAVKGTSLSGAEVTTIDIPAATTDTAGVMSAEDKRKIDYMYHAPSAVAFDGDLARFSNADYYREVVLRTNGCVIDIYEELLIV